MNNRSDYELVELDGRSFCLNHGQGEWKYRRTSMLKYSIAIAALLAAVPLAVAEQIDGSRRQRRRSPARTLSRNMHLERRNTGGSAKDFAPGQRKEEGSSAKEQSPGHLKEQFRLSL